MNKFDMELTRRFAEPYKNGSKKVKTKIITHYCKLARCTRNAGKKRLRREVRRMFKPIIFSKPKQETRGRKKKYTQIHYNLIEKVWILSGRICAERISSALSDYITQLKEAGKLNDFSPKKASECRHIKLGTLKTITARFVKSSKNKYKGNSEIYKKVPIDANFKRFVKQPGNFEVDYVEHSGGNSSGTFTITGTYVDLFSQWTVRAAALGKHLKSVTEIYNINMNKIYHSIFRLHPDNCKATLKMLTERVAHDNKLQDADISRSRPYKKNDNAHVEQKNGDKVRKLVGYFRYDKSKEVKLLNELYEIEDLITNFFTPSSKLKYKEIDKKGRVVRRVHDKAATPYKRLMRSRQVSTKTKEKLRAIKQSLNLVELRNRSEETKRKLARFTT